MDSSTTKITSLERALDVGLIVITAVLAYLWLDELWPSPVTLSVATTTCATLSLNTSLCGLETYDLLRMLSYAVTVLSVLAAAMLVSQLLKQKTLPGLVWVALAVPLLIYPAYGFIILKIKATDGPGLVLQASIVASFILLGLFKHDLAHPAQDEPEPSR
jgi:hypothetical protein